MSLAFVTVKTAAIMMGLPLAASRRRIDGNMTDPSLLPYFSELDIERKYYLFCLRVGYSRIATMPG